LKIGKNMKNTILLMLTIFVLVGCATDVKLVETRELMDTAVTITLYGSDMVELNNTLNLAFDEIERVESLMSIYTESDVYNLNGNGVLENASEEILFVINQSLYYSEISNGAFDITVQPMLDLYSYSFGELKRPPTDEEILDGLEEVGFSKVRVVDDTIYLDGTKITLGGIAKGYSIDKAIEKISELGVSGAMVNAGGDIRVLGSKPSGDWVVALENPRDSTDLINTFSLNDKSIATSGDYRRYFDESLKAHHIMNPKTGKSATELISVTIISDKAIDADALATSVFVLGPVVGLELVESLDEVEGLLITSEKEIIESTGLSTFYR